jgi:hypothetical protein
MGDTRLEKRHSERGEGGVQGFLWLAAFALALYAGWNIIPVYIANYSLADKVNQIARSPRGVVKDEMILDMLMKEVRENSLDPYIDKSCFHVTTLETSRRISCEYERVEKVLPGVTHTFHFSLNADQPLIY